MAATIVSIMNWHGIGASLTTNSVRALDFALNEATHQWIRIPLGGNYFAYKNVATGNLFEHWDLKEGSGNTVAMRDATNDPKCQWFESKYMYDDIFIGLRNRAGRLFIDHYASSEIRTSAEDLAYVERHWCLVYHHRPRTTPELATLKNFKSGSLGIFSSRPKELKVQRIPVGEGYFVYKNEGTVLMPTLKSQRKNGENAMLEEGGSLFKIDAFAGMLRYSGSGEVDTRHKNIRDHSDLWRVEPREAVETWSMAKNDDSHWMIQPKELSSRTEAIAEGIYYATWAYTDVIVKETKHKNQFQREMWLWSKLRHSNIGRFYGANFTTEPYFIVSERVETLDAYITRQKPETKGVYELVFQAAAGLRYLHHHKIVRGDINGTNIGVDEHGVAVLTGFGLNVPDSEASSVEEEPGVLQWCVPEFDKKSSTFSTDVFSLGMCVVAAINGTKYPRCSCKHVNFRKCYEAHGIPGRIPHCMSEDQWELLKTMLVFESDDRSALDHVLEILANLASGGDRNTLNADKSQESAEETITVQAEEGSRVMIRHRGGRVGNLCSKDHRPRPVEALVADIDTITESLTTI